MTNFNKKAIVASILLVVGVVAVWKYFFQSRENELMKSLSKEQATPSVTPTEVVTEPPVQTMKATEKTVRVETSYQSPAGTDPVAFALTVDAEGIITGVKTEVLSEHPISKKRQEAFAEAILTIIVGKKLSELTTVDRVGMSTLTTNAFNAVIDDLQAEL